MLIDNLINAPYIGSVRQDSTEHKNLQTLARAAGKYELAPDFAQAAENLAQNFDGIVKALPFCRLPYPITWIEVAQQHRPLFLAGGMHYPGIQHTPLRVGFLCVQHPRDYSFNVFQFWTLALPTPDTPHCCHGALWINPAAAVNAKPIQKVRDRATLEISEEWIKASPEVRGILYAICTPILVPFIDRTLYKDDPRLERAAWELAAADWSGEMFFLLATLALMNTKNVVEVTHSDLSKLNKVRAKQRKPPRAEFHTLTISRRLMRYASVRSGNHRDLPFTLVSGHWKVRKSGIYWWRAHARGDRKHGISPHAYKVKL